jgi:TRAP-type C4-dicarboxylate transport system permease small subunit
MYHITVPRFLVDALFIAVYGLLTFWGWHVIQTNLRKLRRPGLPRRNRLLFGFWIAVTILPTIGFAIATVVAVIFAIDPH